MNRILFVLLLFVIGIVAQENSEWDNGLFLGNKMAWKVRDVRLSGEIQARLDNNMQRLDNWFGEIASTFLLSPNWEMAPDFRFSIYSDHVELRPGFGVIRKDIFGRHEHLKHQLVSQLKYQADFNSSFFKSGLRLAVFYNYVIKRKHIPNLAVGIFQTWSEEFTGLQYIRFGAGYTLAFDAMHALNFVYFVGLVNSGSSWGTDSGTLMVQLIINFDKGYKYIPAKYISF